MTKKLPKKNSNEDDWKTNTLPVDRWRWMAQGITTFRRKHVTKGAGNELEIRGTFAFGAFLYLVLAGTIRQLGVLVYFTPFAGGGRTSFSLTLQPWLGF
jgi:hypothetical protein